MTPRARFVVVTLAALLTCAVTARLGLWQLDRAAQKTALHDELQDRGRMPVLAPTELARSAEQVGAQLHRRVALQGEWLADRSVYLDNRQMNGRPGFYLVTPLRLADGDAVLVQRGWVPRNPHDRSAVPALPDQPGLVTLSGRIIPEPSRLFEFQAEASGLIRQNLDLQSYGRETGLNLRPLVLLQLQPASPNDTLLRQWPVVTSDVSKHHGYAFQWFALSALVAGLYVWFQLVRPRRLARSASAA